MAMYNKIDLNIFPKERQQRLESIDRYHYFDVLFYRSNLWMHSQRVLWLLEEVAPIAERYIKFDVEKARALALVHDDAEMITGDIQAIVKARISKEELKELENNELKAIKQLVKKFPKQINGYSYEKLLNHAAKKDCIEAQLVSYVDKMDAYCESLHEVYAGNMSLIRSVIFNANIIPLFSKKFPKLKPFLESKESPFTFIGDQISPYKIQSKKYSHLGKPFTKETVKLNNDFYFYKRWKEIVIKKGKIDWLIKQKEFLPKN
jgi:hypothetical protein